LIDLAGAGGVLEAAQAQTLKQAHAAFLQRALACTLDARPRLAARDEELALHARAVLEIAASIGLAFA